VILDPFEVLSTDLLGRVGRLKTRKGNITTPALLPVVNPFIPNAVSASEIVDLGFQGVTTNAYLILRNAPECTSVHNLLKIESPVMTDSGAYQLLRYGTISVDQERIIAFQKRLESDIAVILDVPTGGYASEEQAMRTAIATYQRAVEALPLIKDDNRIWVAPIQGGPYTHIVDRIAAQTAALDYSMYAVGSPTELLEEYNVAPLARMVWVVRQRIPYGKPLHLFGAGHPIVFALFAALGCDTFDSAAYAIYARDDRYMTPYGTKRLKDLVELPCSCSICKKFSEAKELLDVPKPERERLLALHNLNICLQEEKAVRQAIREGRLWEYAKARCLAHPALKAAFRVLVEGAEKLIPFTRTRKRRGLFFYDHDDLNRPEVLAFKKFLKEKWFPRTSKVLLLRADKLEPHLERFFLNPPSDYQVCLWGGPFLIIPCEIAHTYPLFQFEAADCLISEEDVLWIADLLVAKGVNEVLLVRSGDPLESILLERLRSRGVQIQVCDKPPL